MDEIGGAVSISRVREGFPILVDGTEVKVNPTISLRLALIQNGIYIPGLCEHPDLTSTRPFSWASSVWQGNQEFHHCCLDENGGGDGPPPRPHCRLCWVEVKGKGLVLSCELCPEEGMEVSTSSPKVVEKRKETLKEILAEHPHSCLLCPHREGCDRVQCSMNVPVEERCCELLGRCEIGKVAEWIGIPNDTPAYRNLGRAKVEEEPLFLRDYELCIGCGRCVKVCEEIRGAKVLGAVWDGKAVRVGTRLGPGLDESQCLFCTLCVGVCPTGALRDHKEFVLPTASAPPCVEACPLHIDIPGYVARIANGEYEEAYRLIWERAVLPGVLGYACFHPCEDVCRHQALNKPVSICALKRFVADWVGDQVVEQPTPLHRGYRVAVVGSGPAGLAAAAELARGGVEACLLEKEPVLGGMLSTAFPQFRLPYQVVERDVAKILALGVKVRTGCVVNSPQELFQEGYQAVIWAVGRGKPIRLKVPGEELGGVISGVEFLSSVNKGEITRVVGKVVVIGGGSVAVDSAMVALRLGGFPVTMVSLERLEELPAHPDELHLAEEEGVTIKDQWGVKRFIGDDYVQGIELIRCLRVFDPQGRFSPQFDESESDLIPADFVIVAIGQNVESPVNELTRIPGVFVCGDCSLGPSSIVQAMADGVKAAREVLQFIDSREAGAQIAVSNHKVEEKGERGSGKRWEMLPPLRFGELDGKNRSVVAERFHPFKRPVEERVGNLEIIYQTLWEADARKEALRCLRCDLRSSLTPIPYPPDPWLTFPPKHWEQVPDQPGVVILADKSHEIIFIGGGANIKELIKQRSGERTAAAYVRWEIDPMFTKRESELIQAFLQKYGKLPGGGELDDLFD